MLKSLTSELIVYREKLRGGQMWSRVIRRGQVLRLIDVEGGATPAALFYNARLPLERYNMPDTLKAQQIARLTEGAVLYSDMGRILMSLIHDGVGWHDTISGHLDAAASERKYGAGRYQELRNEFYRNTHDNFLIELGKYGLGERDIVPNVNFFTQIKPSLDGKLEWATQAQAGASVDLRAEMDVLVVLSNTPHPWDPGNKYAPRPLELVVWRAEPVTRDDVCRNFRPENGRGFQLTEQYLDLTELER
ncbi:MAG TPA: urea amidolyase associated protein UAAP1 [Polyangiaceae bacterium]|nr:urea amidolyase associated protein UAAP1 [Polyangiaceae bacterium]